MVPFPNSFDLSTNNSLGAVAEKAPLPATNASNRHTEADVVPAAVRMKHLETPLDLTVLWFRKCFKLVYALLCVSHPCFV